MSNPTQSLLPLPLPSEDKRPLPEIVADGKPDPDGWPAFSLAYHDVDGKRYYAIQDWIRGVAQTDNPRNFWNMLKKRMIKAGIELYTWCVQLKYRASDGKRYTIDHTDAEGLYRIAQRMDANTGLRDRILNYLAKSGVKLDEYRVESLEIEQLPDDPDKVLESVINTYRRFGKSDNWIDARMRSAIQRKRFTEAFQKALREKPTQFHFAEITDDLRRGLWRRTSRQLRREMALKSGVNVRDHMSEVALNFETLGESLAEAKLKQTDSIAFEQAEDIVFTSGKMLCPQANAASKWLGIDIPTGRPLLPAQTRKRA